MAKNKIELGMVAMCDNAYRDLFTNKAILAGVYSGDIIVPSVPASINVQFYVEVLNPSELDSNIEFQILVGDKEVARGSVEVNEQKSVDPAVVILPPVTLHFGELSSVEMRASVGSAKYVSALKRSIRLIEPTA